MEEVKEVIFMMKPWAAPGSDGFQAGFYQETWSIVGDNLVSMVQHFFKSKHILTEMNDTYQVLIPKISALTQPADFRTISLCNISYKLISKILANRLKPLLDKIISPSQVAYVPGRHIQDNLIIAHELIHSMKKTKDRQGWVGIKLDMSKAFDRIEWGFLKDVLFQIGFHEDWIQLIDQCISTTTISIILNGVPESQGKIHGIKVNRSSPSISHLCFADDILLFLKAKLAELSMHSDTTDENYRFRGEIFGAAFTDVSLKNTELFISARQDASEDTRLGRKNVISNSYEYSTSDCTRDHVPLSDELLETTPANDKCSGQNSTELLVES
ncbi:hypothetical protein C5167_005619 [Papaver somniferum]|uniref:Reverse transcriptase domain-containing protein n=1 Tax=Papaver somniferum TaxID=3469 RepID=A0A4Y7JB21_PAPSO|nr:hypothetical protein C5167_005619 [Papaver somniferum]